MLILALDTTTRAGSVAVVRDDEVISVIAGDASRTHGERLPAEIDRALVEAGIRLTDVEVLVVARGPGAFTGLRIGLAAIQGMAMVLDRPVVGVSALDALACATWQGSSASEQLLFAWMDAQRGEVFSATYSHAEAGGDFPWRALDTPIVGTPRTMLESLDGSLGVPRIFVGDGAVRYRAEIEALTDGQVTIADAPTALAPSLAFIGRRLALRGAALPPHALRPLYVRRPDAERDRIRRAES